MRQCLSSPSGATKAVQRAKSLFQSADPPQANTDTSKHFHLCSVFSWGPKVELHSLLVLLRFFQGWAEG